MSDIRQDLVQLCKKIENRLNEPDLPDQEKAELFATLNLFRNRTRTSK